MFTVYIIYSEKLKKFYVGHSGDLTKRLLQHNTGFSKFTSKATDWTVKYNETFETRELAFKREMEIKNKKKQEIY